MGLYQPSVTSCSFINVINVGLEKKVLVIVLLTGLVLATYQFSSSQKKIDEFDKKLVRPNLEKLPEEIKLLEKRIAIVKVPAVDNEGNGVATTLKVEALPGEGRILTNINQLLFWVDTQYSIQIAKDVAENTTKVNLSNIDLVYSIETEASIIEGPSAGAALTLATIAVLENRIVNSSVSITGTINPDGTIGPVGGILAKALASKDVGTELFLVPKGQGLQTGYKPLKQCQKIGLINYCTIEYEKESIDITGQSGVEVREVSTVQEALKYFLT